MIRKIKSILLFLCITIVAFSQNTISVTPRQDTILIGDHLIVDVVLKAENLNDIASIDFGSWRSLSNLVYRVDTNYFEKKTEVSFIGENDWKITDGYLGTPVESIEGWFVNGNTIKKPIKISIYDEGIFALPPPKIIHKSGRQYPSLETPKIMVMNADLGIPQDSISLMPIKPIIAEATTWEDYKTWLYILGFIILAPFLIKLLFRKKEVETIQEEKEVYIPAHIKAMGALKSLRSKELWQSGNIKQYQSELTDIIRRYLGDRFDVNALEMTTDEINRELKKKDFDAKHGSMLQRILTIADLVKFAKAKPPVDINEQFMEEAVSFVESTKKIEIQTEDHG